MGWFPVTGYAPANVVNLSLHLPLLKNELNFKKYLIIMYKYVAVTLDEKIRKGHTYDYKK